MKPITFTEIIVSLAVLCVGLTVIAYYNWKMTRPAKKSPPRKYPMVVDAKLDIDMAEKRDRSNGQSAGYDENSYH